MELNHLLEAYKATTLTDELPEVLSNVNLHYNRAFVCPNSSTDTYEITFNIVVNYKIAFSNHLLTCYA